MPHFHLHLLTSTHARVETATEVPVAIRSPTTTHSGPAPGRWSLGITAIELAESRPPLAAVSAQRAPDEVLRRKPPRLKNEDFWSAEFQSFVSQCLVKDHEQRTRAGNLLSHPFFQGIDEAAARAGLLANRHVLRGWVAPAGTKTTAVTAPASAATAAAPAFPSATASARVPPFSRSGSTPTANGGGRRGPKRPHTETDDLAQHAEFGTQDGVSWALQDR